MVGGAHHNVTAPQEVHVVRTVQEAELHHPVAQVILGLGELPGVHPLVFPGHGHSEGHPLFGQPTQGVKDCCGVLVVVPPLVPQHEGNPGRVDTDRAPRHIGQFHADRHDVARLGHAGEEGSVGQVGCPVQQSREGCQQAVALEGGVEPHLVGGGHAAPVHEGELVVSPLVGTQGMEQLVFVEVQHDRGVAEEPPG